MHSHIPHATTNKRRSGAYQSARQTTFRPNLWHALRRSPTLEAVKSFSRSTRQKKAIAALAITPLMIVGCGTGESEPQTVTETVKELPPVTETVTETATETTVSSAPSPTRPQTQASDPRENPVGTTGDPSGGFEVLDGYVIERCDTSGNYQKGMTYFTNGETGFTTYCANS